jgi:hypothetical protein
VIGSVDKTLFTLKHGNDFLLVHIYVEDIIFSGSSHVLVSSFQEMMENEFQMSMMGELTFFLGIHVKQMKQDTFVHQVKYMKNLMKKFNMAELKPMSTPMGMAMVLDPNENDEVVDQREYRSMIGSLLYHTATRPDIQFVVFLCARFQASPHSSHRQAIQRIFRYLKYTLKFGTPLLLHCILLGFLMLILSGVELIEKALLVDAIFLDPLLFVGLLANKPQLHNLPQRLSM